MRSSDLDRSVGFYGGVLGLRPSSLIYLQVDDLDATVGALRAASVTVESEPHVIFRDDAGQFGPAGAQEWMAFVRDPDENLLGLVEVRLGDTVG